MHRIGVCSPVNNLTRVVHVLNEQSSEPDRYYRHGEVQGFVGFDDILVFTTEIVNIFWPSKDPHHNIFPLTIHLYGMISIPRHAYTYLYGYHFICSTYISNLPNLH